MTLRCHITAHWIVGNGVNQRLINHKAKVKAAIFRLVHSIYFI